MKLLKLDYNRLRIYGVCVIYAHTRDRPSLTRSFIFIILGFCTKLNLPSLQVRRHYLSICFLHDIYHKHTSLSFDQFCDLNSMPSRSHHLSLIPPTSTINSRRFSFFVNTTFLWNSIPIHILEDRNTKSFPAFLI